MACGDFHMIEQTERYRLEKELEDLKQRTGICFGEAMGLANAKPFYDEDLIITTVTVVDEIKYHEIAFDDFEINEEIILSTEDGDEDIIFEAAPGFFDFCEDTKDGDWAVKEPLVKPGISVIVTTGGCDGKTAPKSLTQTFENIDDHRLGALSKAEGYGD